MTAYPQEDKNKDAWPIRLLLRAGVPNSRLAEVIIVAVTGTIFVVAFFTIFKSTTYEQDPSGEPNPREEYLEK